MKTEDVSVDLGLRDKVYMIAGASRGLGYAIASALAGDGASVSLASRDREQVEHASRTLEETTPGRAIGVACDVRDPEALAAWTARTLEAFDGLDGIAVNAGGPPPGGFDGFDDAAWHAAFELTLMSAVRMIRVSLPHLRARGGGAILTLTSLTVKEPAEALLLSNVMRAGVTSLAKTLSRDLAAHNIRVNNLVPGLIATDRMQQLDVFEAEMRSISADQVRSGRESSIPIGRYGSPDEFGKVGAFLLSPAASYMTGATVVVDGGSMRTVW
jgi:3-oxoacyl-[acyl-carrier protein] reductase